MLPENSIPIIGTRAFEPKNIMSSFPELPNIEPSRAELLKTCGSRAKFRAEPRLDTPLNYSRGGSSLDSARKKARLEGVLGDSDSARAIFVGLDADS